MVGSWHRLRVKSGLQSSSDVADLEISRRKAAMTWGWYMLSQQLYHQGSDREWGRIHEVRTLNPSGIVLKCHLEVEVVLTSQSRVGS
jgi:hypothetical protein